MAVKTSGQLSLRYDIAAEVDGSTSNIRLRSLSSAAGFGTPDRMSEFYGYSAISNSWYMNSRAVWLANTGVNSPATLPYNLGGTMMGWFRVQSTTKKNQILFATGSTTNNTRGAIRVAYQSNLNRIQIALWDRLGVRRMRREYPLHDNPNRAITGVTNSGSGWRRDQQGNSVYGDGFVHIAAAWTGGNNSGDLTLYWNGLPLTYSVNNNSTSVNMGSEVEYRRIAFLNSNWQGANVSVFEGDSDNAGFFDYLVDAGEIEAYVNSGNQFPRDYSWSNGPGPYYAQGFENGQLSSQIFDQFGHNPGLVFGGGGGTSFQNY